MSSSKSGFLRLFILSFIFLTATSVFISCTSSKEEAEKQLEKEINNDPEVSVNDTIEILDENEQISAELNEELNEEIDKQVNDKDIDSELEALMDDVDKAGAAEELGTEEDEEDPLK